LLLGFLLSGISNLDFASSAHAASPKALFEAGTAAYRASEYPVAAGAFQESASFEPASGTLLNLGLSEWQQGHIGPAILAWEQSAWLNPIERSASGNLRFARKTAQVEAPDLVWYEVVSAWLPVNWWVAIGTLSLWTSICIVLLPAVFRWQKSAWQQGVAATALTLFLLCLPAFCGVHTRSRLGFIFPKDCPLRFTPTSNAQIITRLNSGEPARFRRSRGNFLLIQTSRASGWVQKDEFALIAGNLRK
jgi:hypothetical protein